MASIFGIAVTGLNAARAALNTTSQNISNVNTQGYHRKTIDQSALYPISSGYGFPGDGVEVTDVRRVYDKFLDRQVQTATSANSFYETQTSYLEQLDAVVANSTTGLSPRIQSFFSALQTLSSNTSSIASRQALVDQSSSLVTAFKSADDRIQELRSGVNTELRSSVTAINGLAQQVAALNKQISQLTRQDGVHMPNDLIDQRDQSITELNKYINATSVPLSDGTVNLFIGNGQSLVLSGDAYTLEAKASAANPEELSVFYAGSASFELPSNLLSGGSVGGALAVRATLDDTQTRLGAMVMNFAESFNKQHALGVDKNGDAGSNEFFKLNYNFPPFAAPVVLDPTNAQQQQFAMRALSLGVTQADKIAAASSFTNTPATATQSAKLSSLSIDNASMTNNALVTSIQGGSTLAVAYDNAGALTVTTPAAGYQVLSVPGQSGGYKVLTSPAGDDTGVRFKVAGALNGTGGGSFNITQRVIPSPLLEQADNSNLLALTGLQTANVISVPGITAKTSLQGAFGQMVTAVGSKTNEVKVVGVAKQNVLTEVSQAREAVSGVNLDEEASNLLRFQQAYQASSKVIQVAGGLFDSVLQAIR